MSNSRKNGLVALFALVVLTLFAAAPSASAHAALVSSDPRDAARLDNPPATVSLRFSEAIDPTVIDVVVRGPDSERQWQQGSPSVAGDTVTTTLQPLGPAGEYEIRYRVVSADGHPVSGSVSFTLTTPGPDSAAQRESPAPSSQAPPVSPAAGQAAPEEGGVPVVVWIIGALVLLAAGAVVALRVSRSPGNEDS